MKRCRSDMQATRGVLEVNLMSGGWQWLHDAFCNVSNTTSSSSRILLRWHKPLLAAAQSASISSATHIHEKCCWSLVPAQRVLQQRPHDPSQTPIGVHDPRRNTKQCSVVTVLHLPREDNGTTIASCLLRAHTGTHLPPPPSLPPAPTRPAASKREGLLMVTPTHHKPWAMLQQPGTCGK
jgi:hypothetical protein